MPSIFSLFALKSSAHFFASDAVSTDPYAVSFGVRATVSIPSFPRTARTILRPCSQSSAGKNPRLPTSTPNVVIGFSLAEHRTRAAALDVFECAVATIGPACAKVNQYAPLRVPRRPRNATEYKCHGVPWPPWPPRPRCYFVDTACVTWMKLFRSNLGR